MNRINISADERTPTITGDIDTGELLIKGRSYPEDAKGFYSEFRNWLDLYFGGDTKNLNIVLDLEYVNTATTVFLTNMVRELANLKHKKNIKVVWNYDSDDLEMQEVGNDFKRILGDSISLNERDIEIDSK
jgi:hypothetical protein